MNDQHAGPTNGASISRARSVHSLALRACICFLLTFSSASAQQPLNPPMLSPEEALAAIELVDGFRVELVAAEPLVQDPVNFDWGPDGKLWIVEMADYPLGLNGTGKPGGRVKVLEDEDGDGVYDRSTLFADGLNTPTGIMVWRDGVLVSGAPDVIYLEDTTGDGKADRRDVLFTGFAEGNQQHRVNGFCWGLDNWVYLANGDSGGTITSTRTGQSIDINGRDLRIRPETGEMETQAGRTQFGRNRDDWGNWFGCNNPNPIFHFVLDEHYLRRNPHAKFPSSKRDIRSGSADVFPIGPFISHCDTKYRPLGAKPQFTSACGVMPYRDTLFGPEYENVTFTSEPVYNIIHARKLVSDGVTFRSEKLHAEGEEFFRSKDPWCRPTAVHVGPDGALYVADMVREVLEHPEWIDDKLEATLDLYSGADRGRIYRIMPKASERRLVPKLSQMTSLELVAQLASPSGSQRDLVHQMLIWRNDASVFVPLKNLVRHASEPLARLHALSVLEGLGKLNADIVRTALGDKSSGVRKLAVRLSEQFDIDWRSGLSGMTHDPDPAVRLQLAYSLGEIKASWTSTPLFELALNCENDSYMLAAIISSVNDRNLADLCRTTCEFSGENSEEVTTDLQRHLLPALLKFAAESNRDDLVDASIRIVLENAETDDSGASFRQLSVVLDAAGPALSQIAGSTKQKLRQRIEGAREILRDHGAFVESRSAATGLLMRQPADSTTDLELIAELLQPQTPPEVCRALVDRAARTSKPGVAAALLGGWKSHGPALRTQILSVVASRPGWVEELIRQLQAGEISVSAIDPVARQNLLTTKNSDHRRLLNELFSSSTSASRQDILNRYRAAIDLQGSVDRGRQLFRKTCATCHRVDGIGNDVGANLATLTNKSPEALLVAILDPGRAVEAKFLNYIAVTDDGRTHNGILAEETATTVTLVAAEAKKTTLLRNQLEELVSTSKSMMPEGLEKDLTPQDLADVMAFVVNNSTQSE